MSINVITNLSNALLPKLKRADQIYIAVGLLNLQGLNFLLENTKKSCEFNFLLGTDLPTDPKALNKLNKLQFKSNMKVRLFKDKNFYHPKLYLTKSSKTFTGFVGSANCTGGGLNKNIELSFQINDQVQCKYLRTWFGSAFDNANFLTNDFLKIYRVDYAARMRRKSKDEEAAKDEKKILGQEFVARETLIRKLRKWKNGREYEDTIVERKEAISELRHALDYPNFKIIDVDRFFTIESLGHIIPIPKPTIKKQIVRFRRLLKTLCNEQIDVAKRYDLALTDELKITGVNEALISKILTICDPVQHCVINSKSRAALKKYGIELPRNLNGEKYKYASSLLTAISKETGIENLAILDYFLYLEGM